MNATMQTRPMSFSDLGKPPTKNRGFTMRCPWQAILFFCCRYLIPTAP
jgi:hypothetical protein